MKTEGSKGSVGSNPTTSAKFRSVRIEVITADCLSAYGGSIPPQTAKFCLCVYGYPYVIREPTKPFVYVLDARSKRSRYVQRTTWTLCDDKQIHFWR